MHTKFLKLATYKPNNEIIHIDTVDEEREKRKDCFCTKCNKKLEAVLDFQDYERSPFFRHSDKSNCEGAQETALHLLGKQILLDHTKINLPQLGILEYSNPVAEKRVEKIKPDVSVVSNNKPFYFEVFVSNEVNSKKEKYIIKNNLNCVEIDLSKNKESSLEEIYFKVLEDVLNKKFIHYLSEEDLKRKKEQMEAFEKCINFLKNHWGKIILFVVSIIYYFYRTHKKPTNKKYQRWN